MRFVKNFVCNHLIKTFTQQCAKNLLLNFAKILFQPYSIVLSSLKKIDKAKIGKILSMYFRSLTSPMQVNLSFTYINTKAFLSCIEFKQFTIRFKWQKSIKLLKEVRNILSQAIDAIDVLFQLLKDETTISTDKIY